MLYTYNNQSQRLSLSFWDNIHTGEAELIEGNDWGDITWGVCNGIGENKLGKILMKLRLTLRSYNESN